MDIKEITTLPCWCKNNCSAELHSDFTKKITDVRPSERQLKFLQMEYYNFIHFGINTFYGREWGDGKEDISRFNPKKLDTDQWCEVLKKTGSRGIIFTAKHHDGFCLFDTKYTNHSVMYSPFGKDILKMLSISCKKYGLKLGVYLSPWDRHESTYGTEKYNDYFVNQLTELCTNYGELFCLWFDGACGEGENGKKQVYDWERYYTVIRKLQPDAVISISGPDVRWIGNEGGRVRESEWSVIPLQKDSIDTVAENSQTDVSQTKLMAEKLDDKTADLGSREVLKKYDELVFKPAEADVSINLGWFHTRNIFSHAKRSRSAKALADIYFKSVGGNASMLLNVPPNKQGLIGRSERKRLEKFTELISVPFKNRIEGTALFTLDTEGNEVVRNETDYLLHDGEMGIKVKFSKKSEVGMIVLSENLSLSQRIEKFSVYAVNDSTIEKIYTGTVIGSKKIIKLSKKITADEIIIIPTQSRENPSLKDIEFYI